ncbi:MULTISPECIES: fluoride efflux transporter CrcB [Legionella]|uniref:Fluoride-specific ion channel FluC n=1 Tax=Legionella drozanskii LLAP-1 TaxID=1212489 RepID=A0A0W0SUU5_9GAMM|nr:MULTISPECIES: fluoride efflux transporter CrcB [Legionella]KTC87151.1 hypothetical protein Ldro_1823 [Legionella drozanskii LLAP-1]PJE17423.1 MAG: fluoride efflux transporter CrcB [Legionella sp.]
MWKSLISIGLGAALGAIFRWFLSLKLNHLFPSIPPGTLVANLIGGYIIGLAIAYFTSMPSISSEWRLFIITGFCGGLTTFSTFSAEIVALLQEEQYGMFLGEIASHLMGSILMTIAGMATWFGLQHFIK